MAGILLTIILVMAIVYFEFGSDIVTGIIPPVPSLDVNDAYNRVLLTSGTVNYVEAPAYSQVLSQNITDSCDASVTYKTAGLIISKSFARSGNSLSLSYQVTPWKANTTVKSMNLTFWVPTNVAVVGNRTNSNSLTLDLSSGSIGLRAMGHPVKILVGPDPVYGQYRAIFIFPLSSHGDTAGVLLTFGGGLSCKQSLTSRPLMEGADDLILSTSLF